MESVSISIQVDRERREAQEAVADLEQAGLFETNVLHNLNVVIGRVALTGAIDDTLQNLKNVDGVKGVTADLSTLDDWII